MVFKHIDIVILIHETSTGRALHWHCRVQGSSPIHVFLYLLLD